MMAALEMINAHCDRCGKVSESLRPFKLSETITHRGKRIEFPWLCLRCLMAEKKKWWALKEDT